MKYPLMRNNFTSEDFKPVIELLQQEDPMLTQSKHVIEFEKKWSIWLGVKYSVFVNSGSSANLLSLTLLKLKYPNGGEVIVPPLTWVSDITSILINGFTPVFVDINFNTLSLNTDKVSKAINSKTVAIFLTHAQGFNGLTNKLLQIIKEKKLFLIEDVCESHGAKHNNYKVGTYGWLSNFSFYYAHHMSTIEGGMICTNDYAAYQQLKMMRGHGMLRESDDENLKGRYLKEYPDLNPKFIFTTLGYNVRNTEIGALLGLSQLKKIDKQIELRNKNFKLFLSLINPDYFIIDYFVDGMSNYAFNLVLKEKDDFFMNKLMTILSENGVEYRRGSAGGGNQLRQPYLKNIPNIQNYKDFKVTEHIHFYGLYIGNFPQLNENEIREICGFINECS
ncbi:DegT/DnrJ/EryC1/StrS aminotransferase family protein [Alphaproteobacteria bacterium]|jgi:CDP-4-dehydro-6-deoxyglucose reductase, E1|nr:DegT/DnrJ/EryC1/StrS aminotransferase family protein [Alphaproteobacteria bacterium]